MKKLILAGALAVATPLMLTQAHAMSEYEWLQRTSCKAFLAGARYPHPSDKLRDVTELYLDSCKDNMNACLVDFMGGASPGHPRVAKCHSRK